jgi:glycosyltransferase involved in cell wall biosynthesis
LVVTIHDMVAIEYPELHPPHAVDAARRRLRATEHASAILPNSNATAEVLVRLGVDRSRLTVVHHAPHPLPEVPAEEAGIAGPYLLAVGELTLRKDYPTMFQAFAAADLPAHRLVVVGPRGFGAETVEAAAVASGLDDRLVIVGYASERRLSALYAGAVALCQTSRQEGFGLPVVEGMRHALPIIACDIDIVHEVAGEAAVTAPVGDVRGFAAAMEAVVRDEALRTRLAAASWARRDRFTWEGTIDGTMAAYRKVLA